ncbi:MAG: SDR family NAD(P)-dependent oxidoreductase [Candidatus Eisenbacteria bacterium]
MRSHATRGRRLDRATSRSHRTRHQAPVRWDEPSHSRSPRPASTSPSTTEQRSRSQEVVSEIEACGRNARAFRADLDDPSAATTLLEAVKRELGPVDVLVLSASSYPMNALGSIEPEDLLRTLRVNLVTPFLLAQSFGLEMKARGRGRRSSRCSVVLISSDCASLLNGEDGLQGKRLSGLARALAPTVRVNGIAPGAVLLPEDLGEERREAVRKDARGPPRVP